MSNYGQTPIIFLISSIYSSTSYPNIFALPFVKFSNPVSIEIVVVLPAPLPPNNAKIYP